MKMFLTGLGVVLFLGVNGAACAEGFEVAAIRTNRSGDSNTHIETPEGGRFVVTNATLKTLIRNAYGLLSFQFGGGPGWLDTEYFDINARTGSPEKLTGETLKPLLQNLLADRFHLKVHWETREAQIYWLVQDKSGNRLRESNATVNRGMNTRKGPGKAQMRGTFVQTAELASNLGNQLGRYVNDETGLSGRYDFLLDWDPDQTGDMPGPSLFTAVREQLGLLLEPRKGPVQVLVIDSAEKPSEN